MSLAAAPEGIRLQEILSALLSDLDLWPEAELEVLVIANPRAGVFRHRRWLKRLLQSLELGWAPGLPRRRRGPCGVRWVFTAGPGAEAALVRELWRPLGPNQRRLWVSAGGDGTALHLTEALGSQRPAGLSREDQDREALLRLPFGSGNDGTDAADGPGLRALLTGRLALKPLDTVRLFSRGRLLKQGFNIASIGLDAYVVHLSEGARTWLPGALYAPFVSLAGLWFPGIVGPGAWRLDLLDRLGQVTETHEGLWYLAAFGASGHRRYGGGMKVLPDERNLCLVRRAGFGALLRHRSDLYAGEHGRLAWVSLHQAAGLRVQAEGALPVQADGESFWVGPGDYPLEFRRESSGLNGVRPLLEEEG